MSRLSYTAKGGVPEPAILSDDRSYPNMEEGQYIIGEFYKADTPSGEFYIVKSDTVWGVAELLNN